MMQIRRSADRGFADHGWLKSFHSFSFAGYHDPAWMGFANLRVINQDQIAPGGGFGTHGHRDMEIISYVTAGALAHKDSIGTGAVIVPGEVQRMSAGSGIQHSEFNHANNETTHFFQIWIEPNQRGITPSYEQKAFDETEKRGRLRLVASPDGADSSVKIHADAKMYAGLFNHDPEFAMDLPHGSKAYVHVVGGTIQANGYTLNAGDALLIDAYPSLSLSHGIDAEVIVFSLFPPSDPNASPLT